MSIVKRRLHLLDVCKSCLSTGEIKKYKEEITKQRNNPVCKNFTTVEVAIKGVEAMQADGFRLVEDQLDV